ncbi:HAMP domain-containing sensor histidine kinase [Phenylobacterium sp.]|uniref:GAF domain-containing sensor histidine kinase n=1 Tax=Phenylobacterium sp. TaxID=1871053 RepID=UPI002DE4D51E|nr:HAMP domain-containing sensor histidine kinase [Phenylobacterium sp.]
MPQTIEADVAAVGVIDAVPKLLEVVCRATGMGFAAVARVTEDRWVACAVRDEIAFGLEAGGELEIATTLCDEVRDTCEAVIIDHVAEDPRFRNHPTPAKYGFQSYISVPIVYDGRFFGTLCALDPRPMVLKDSSAPAMFELFAELIGQHLAARERLAESQAALLDARQVGELREQFIAVLGHDLRNPLASIDGAARLIAKTPIDDRARELLAAMRHSVVRMAGLIDNVLDLARGRLGGGLDMDRSPAASLGETLAHVVEELRLAHPDRDIAAEIAISRAVHVDERRMAQLLSNLLANAITHGSDAEPVRVRATAGPQHFEISVANGGPPIGEAARRRLFQPFVRSSARPHGEGLGLGLYIASEIARAHGGALEVTSDVAQTRFTFKMPIEAAAQAGAEAADATA